MQFKGQMCHNKYFKKICCRKALYWKMALFIFSLCRIKVIYFFLSSYLNFSKILLCLKTQKSSMVNLRFLKIFIKGFHKIDTNNVSLKFSNGKLIFLPNFFDSLLHPYPFINFKITCNRA